MIHRAKVWKWLEWIVAFTFFLGYQASSFAELDPGNFSGRIVSQVEVLGNKRIEKDAILAKLTVKSGSALNPADIRSDIQSIFNMGFFADIAVSAVSEKAGPQAGNIRLFFTVKERPAISKIEFSGNERLNTSDLKEVTKVKEWSILDVNKLRDDVALIQKHYEDKGFYLAKVSYELKPVNRDEVEVVYKIEDYDKVQIKRITFLNNRKFTDAQLKAVLAETKEGGFFSFISGSGNFKESAFRQDLQRLTYWYLMHGYVKVRYENPVITISEDKKWLYISIYLEEGEQYKIGKIDFSGDLLFPKEELATDLTLVTDETFNIAKRNEDIQKLSEKYQDLGYAFVNVVPKMSVHDEARTLDIEYQFEKGHEVYFGEVRVLGNAKTHDKVIRRELKIIEGQKYSGSQLRRSRENVERLGYFTPGEVAFNTVTPKGKPDVLDVEITVKERSTGTIQLGAGYGSFQGFFFTTQVSEINLFGRGQTLSLAAQYSVTVPLSQTFSLGFVEPYTLDTLWTTGFDVYSVKYPLPYRYTVSKLGFDVRVGHPIMDYTTAYMTYKYEGLQALNPDPNILQEVPHDSGILSSVIWSVVRDRRNNRFETTAGNYQSATLETAGLGGELRFIKWVLNNRFYHRLVGDLVLRNNVEVGQVSSMGGAPIPPSQRFYLGGPNNMKGYQLYLLGPQTVNSKGGPLPFGGNFEAFTLLEFEYPLIREAGIKVVTFFDAGNTWTAIPTGGPGDPFTIRTDVGFGLRWFSPIGPLRFEWGFPLARRTNEDATVFQFFIGPPF